MSSGPRANVEVVIVGGGPVGLTLGLLLGEAGIETLILEKEAGVIEDLRASTFHPPTLDMLSPYGITAELLARGLICPHWQIRLHPSGERAVFDMSVLAGDTRHPFRLQCEQWKLSRALETRLADHRHVEVRWAKEVAAISQDDAGVSVTTTSGETIRGRVLVGCDGARGVARKAADLPFDGETYPETTLLVTTRFPFEEHLEGLSNVSYCWKEGGNFSLLKVPGRWRVSIYPREDVPIEDQLAPAAIEESLQVVVARPEPYEVVEARPYRVHQRIVPRYVAGRIALAGDAAHLNAPAGGMGLNGGIHDAFELAAALTASLREGADLASRLDLYDRRRRPIAKDEIIAQADRNRARMREKDPAKRREILSGLQAITADRARLRAHLLKSSMIDGLARAAAIG